MKLSRIYGMVLRHFFNLRRSFDRLSDVFYWPVLDIIIWGLTGYYIVSLAPNASQQINAIICGVLLWIIPWRAQNEVAINVLAELWDRNLSNIFVTPLKFSEWISALFIMGIIKGAISLAFASLVAFAMYRVNIFIYGPYIILFAIVLFTFGCTIGLLVASVVLRFGSRIQTLAWTVPWAVAPFSAIYFPVNILPSWGQSISHVLPSSYIYEIGRQLIFKKTFDWNAYAISFVLCAIYFTLSLILFRWSYTKALGRGLQSIS